MEQKGATEYTCEFCDYTTSKQTNYIRHIATRIHKRKQKETIWKQKGASPELCCETCGRSYKSRAGLWKHHKTHNTPPQNPPETQSQSTADLRAEMMEMMKLILERLGNNINNSYNNTTNNSNTTNNNLTVNFFLNETCKNAINMSDLMASFIPSIDQVFAITETTYAKHTASLFINMLKDLDPTERPIHCSDLKRNHYYVKNNDIWMKDDSGEKLVNAFTQMESKQIQQLKEWEKENPDWIDDDKKSTQYLKTLNQILGGNDEKDYEKNKKEAARIINENISLKTAMNDAV
jgi:hypothetical protein